MAWSDANLVFVQKKPVVCLVLDGVRTAGGSGILHAYLRSKGTAVDGPDNRLVGSFSLYGVRGASEIGGLHLRQAVPGFFFDEDLGASEASPATLLLTLRLRKARMLEDAITIAQVLLVVEGGRSGTERH